MRKEMIIEGDFVYEIGLNDDGSQSYRQVAGCILELEIQCSGSVSVNETLPIVVVYKDYKGNIVVTENTEILVSVGQEDIVVGEMAITPLSGAAAFDFVSETEGKYVVKASSKIKTCTPSVKEVRVVA